MAVTTAFALGDSWPGGLDFGSWFPAELEHYDRTYTSCGAVLFSWAMIVLVRLARGPVAV